MSNIIYQPTILMGTTKKGKITCDPDGYYDVILGGFDTYNSAGAYYTFQSAKSHFDASHDFQRRIRSGALYGENGHPRPVPGMSKSDWMIRVLTIDPDKRSHHIRELHLDDTTFKNRDGRPMVTVFGRIKPAGPYGQSLGESLDNEYENTAFSIRSITDDFLDPATGCTIKNMRSIVTYDYVIEPGIDKATKYHHPALESLELTNFSKQHVREAIAKVRDVYSGFEADSIAASLEDLLVERTQRPSGLILPPKLPRSAKWM